MSWVVRNFFRKTSIHSGGIGRTAISSIGANKRPGREILVTTARKDIHDPETEGFFHCYTRCVRRAYLCGVDRLTGRSYEHRKHWIRLRLAELVEIFAIECLSYAVMDNHLHSLLHTQPNISRAWSDDEVARRWRLLFPRRRKADGTPEEPNRTEIESITSEPKLLETYRLRLSDISWFNRCLNEHIARRSNFEDECTGRFWEGRFKSQRLDTEGAVISCAVYIDLNRIRAGCAPTPEASEFTSIQDRILALESKRRSESPKLAEFKAALGATAPSEEEYIQLVDESARLLKNGKHTMDRSIAPIFERLGLRASGWPRSIEGHRRLFRRVVAPLSRLRLLAAERGKAWFQGAEAARLLFA